VKRRQLVHRKSPADAAVILITSLDSLVSLPRRIADRADDPDYGAGACDSLYLMGLCEAYTMAVYVFTPVSPDAPSPATNAKHMPAVFGERDDMRDVHRLHVRLVNAHFTPLVPNASALRYNLKDAAHPRVWLAGAVDVATGRYDPLQSLCSCTCT
jgi:hypothetical protein